MEPKDSQDDYRKKRLDDIVSMLVGIAEGHFAYRLEISDDDDEALQGLIMGLNMMAEELHSIFSRQYLGFENRQLASMTFLLDEGLNIQSIDLGVQKLLSLNSNEVKGKPLENFVTEGSKEVLNQVRHELSQPEPHLTAVELSFKTKGFVVPTLCAVSTLADQLTKGRTILVSAIETIATETMTREEAEIAAESFRRLNFNLSMALSRIDETDFERIEKVQAMIQDLRGEWSLGLLADRVSMKERELTRMFRELNGVTMSEFVMKQRMMKACDLLKNPALQLKEIAHEIGYKNASTFSQTFKKAMKVTPKEYRQREIRKLYPDISL